MNTLWNNWLLIAMIPPFLYATIALLDAWFVDSRVFSYPQQAVIVSSLFGSLPVLVAVPFNTNVTIPELNISAIAFMSGVFFSVHTYFYIGGLFRRNDTVIAETIQNLSVLCIPFLAFLLIDELLSWIHYIALALAAVGVIVMYVCNSRTTKVNLNGCGYLIIAMLFFSLMMVASEWIYQQTDFWSGYIMFSLGLLVSGVAFTLFADRKKLLQIIYCNWKIFALIEGITIACMICTQRAVDISPSVTFIAITECMAAFCILILSVIVLQTSRVSKKVLNGIRHTCKTQLNEYPCKIVAGLFVTTGVYLVYSY